MEQLSWAEICHRYPNEWVVIVDYSLDEDKRVARGAVLAHAPHKADIREQMAKPKDAAILYTGPVRPLAGVMVRFDDDKV
jgi:hypothetical protein